MRSYRAMWPVAVVGIALLAGCSDPAGVAKEEQAAARSSAATASPSTGTPSARPSKRHHGAKSTHRARSDTRKWWQATSSTTLARKNGLRVKTGGLHHGRVKMIVSDTVRDVNRTIVASQRSRSLAVGRFIITRIKVIGSSRTGAGVSFRYRTRSTSRP